MENPRKVLIMCNKKHCYWFGDMIALLKRDHDFIHVSSVRSCGYAIGWLEAERIEYVRRMPEVATINDDYPFLDHDYEGWLKREDERRSRLDALRNNQGQSTKEDERGRGRYDSDFVTATLARADFSSE